MVTFWVAWMSGLFILTGCLLYLLFLSGMRERFMAFHLTWKYNCLVWLFIAQTEMGVGRRMSLPSVLQLRGENVLGHLWASLIPNLVNKKRSHLNPPMFIHHIISFDFFEQLVTKRKSHWTVDQSWHILWVKRLWGMPSLCKSVFGIHIKQIGEWNSYEIEQTQTRWFPLPSLGFIGTLLLNAAGPYPYSWQEYAFLGL